MSENLNTSQTAPSQVSDVKPNNINNKNRNIKIIFISAIAVVLAFAIGIVSAVAIGVNNSAERNLTMANKYLSEGKYREAILTFEKVLEIKPKNKDAILGAADAYVGLGEYDNAINFLNKYSDPDNPDRDITDKIKEVESKVTSVTQNNDAWKQHYIDYITTECSEKKELTYNDLYDNCFKFIYINNDNIPELYYDSGSVAGGAWIITWHNNRVEDIYTYPGGLQYIEKENIMLLFGGHSEHYYDKVCTIQNGKYVTLFDGTYNVVYGAETSVTEYKINDIVVTEQEYKSKLADVFDESKAIEIGYNSNEFYNYYEAINAIQNY